MAKGNIYGWTIVALCFAAVSVAQSSRAALGLVLPLWEREFGWTRSFVSTVAATALLVVACVAPVVGNAVDRLGPRRLLTIGLVATGLGVGATSLVGEAWQLLLAFSLVAALGFGTVANHTVSTAIAQQFTQNRGLVTGTATAGSTAGQLLVVPLLALVIGTVGWRATFAVPALILLALAPVVRLAINRPHVATVRADPTTVATRSGESATAAPRAGRRRHFSQLSRVDKLVLAVMVGVPAFLHILLVWIPAILTGVLSFAAWDNLQPVNTIRFLGFRNYWQVFTIFDNKLFPALFNNFVLIIWLFVCSAIGIAFAYLLDKNIKGTRFYQSVYYFPVVLSVAVVGFIWKAVMFNRDSGLLNIVWPGGPIDFVGDQSKLFEIELPGLDLPLGLSKNFAALLLAMAWRHIGYIMVLYLAGATRGAP